MIQFVHSQNVTRIEKKNCNLFQCVVRLWIDALVSLLKVNVIIRWIYRIIGAQNTRRSESIEFEIFWKPNHCNGMQKQQLLNACIVEDIIPMMSETVHAMERTHWTRDRGRQRGREREREGEVEGEWKFHWIHYWYRFHWRQIQHQTTFVRNAKLYYAAANGSHPLGSNTSLILLVAFDLEL